MTAASGILYVVATPIGNLGDMNPRAIQTLKDVQLIACEDTRHSAVLLRHFGIATPCVACHEHNEREQTERLLGRLMAGESVALVSDAGTPLLSDPGYHLVREARRRGLRVIPIPGPSALIAALSAAGLPTDRFVFEGFLPARGGPRRARLDVLRDEARTMVFYEAPHRIVDTLEDLVEVFGSQREAVLARELTKTFETLHGDALSALLDFVRGDANQQKGEVVLVVRGAAPREVTGLDAATERMLRVLAAELPLKRACALTASLTGEKRNKLYEQALALGLGAGK